MYSHAARLGFVFTRSRTQVRARSGGNRSSDQTHRRPAQQYGALHSRAVFVRFASPERGAHALACEYVQRARDAPALARHVGGARRCDVGSLRGDRRTLP